MLRRRVLICGFEPFGLHAENISAQVAESMDKMHIADCEVEAQILTVDKPGSLSIAERLRKGDRFAGIILMGLAENAAAPRIEVLARDLLDFKIADNSGRQPNSQPITGDGDLSTSSNAEHWPYKSLHLAPDISKDAGAFLCNELYYRTLQAIDDATPCIFLHLPPADKCPNPQLLVRQCVENMLADGPVDVSAAAIVKDGRFLVARRSLGQNHAGMWEFPGGKCEPGETIVECLRREVLEELSLEIDVRDRIGIWLPRLEGSNIRLNVYRCVPLTHSIKLTVHDKVLWCQQRDDLAWLGSNGDIADAVTRVLDAM
jgi:8-oxo-dGTP diphosphatase